MEIPDDSLNDDTVASIIGAVSGAFTPNLRENAIQEKPYCHPPHINALSSDTGILPYFRIKINNNSASLNA